MTQDGESVMEMTIGYIGINTTAPCEGRCDYDDDV